MKKGDWVEFTSKSGVVKKGILQKGGAQFVVHYDFDHRDGTAFVAKGNPKFFRPTEAPLHGLLQHHGCILHQGLQGSWR